MLLAQVYCPAVLTLLPGTCSSWEPTITQNPHLLTGKARVLHLGAVNLLKSKANVLSPGEAAQLSTFPTDINQETGTTTVNQIENSLLQIYTERKFSPSPLIFT